MKEQMTHERCSELLLAYQQGELAPEVAEQVTGHLRGCPDCAKELEGLAALVTGLPELRLDDLERRRLRADIRRGLDEGAEQRGDGAADGWRRKAAPVLAAAALLALIGVGLLVWPGVRPSSELSTAGGDTAESREDPFLGDEDAARPARKAGEDGAGSAGGAPQTESLEVRGERAPQPQAAQDSAAEVSGGGTQNQTSTAAGTLAFGAAPVITDEPYSKARFRPASLLPPRFPRVGASQASYVQRLTRATDDAAVAELIRTCTGSLDASGTTGWLPTLATYYRADEFLVIGFVRPVRNSRILEYELRGWHRDCEHPAPIYRTGRLS